MMLCGSTIDINKIKKKVDFQLEINLLILAEFLCLACRLHFD